MRMAPTNSTQASQNSVSTRAAAKGRVSSHRRNEDRPTPSQMDMKRTRGYHDAT